MINLIEEREKEQKKEASIKELESRLDKVINYNKKRLIAHIFVFIVFLSIFLYYFIVTDNWMIITTRKILGTEEEKIKQSQELADLTTNRRFEKVDSNQNVD